MGVYIIFPFLLLFLHNDSYVPAESYELYSTREDWYYLWDKITVWE